MKPMRLFAASLLLAGMSTLAVSAAADIPNPPPECVGKTTGEACSFQSGETGLCMMEGGELTCVVGAAGNGGGDAKEDEDDGGCAIARGSSGFGAGWLLLAAAGLMAARRRR